MEVKRRTAKSLISKLSSVSDQTRIAALCEIRLLTKTDPEIRPIICEEGAIPYIADTLYSDDPQSQENAAATLLNLSITCRESLISTRGLFDALSHALSNHTRHNPSAVSSAAATIYSLVIEEKHRPVVGSKRDIIYALIDILKDPTSPSRSIKDSLKALFGVSLHKPNRPTMVELGAAVALFGLVVKDGRNGVVEDATAVIAQVAGCVESVAEFRRVDGVRVLVDLVDPGTGSGDRVRENAVSGLLNLVECGGGEEIIKEVGELEGLIEGLRDVAENGSSKGRKRAQALLRVLRNGDGNGNGFDGLGLRDSDDSGLGSGSGSGLNSGHLLHSSSY